MVLAQFVTWHWDPDFAQKAATVLDLYHGTWQGEPLDSKDFIIASDGKTSIQARRRLKCVTAPTPGRHGRVEHEYKIMWAFACMAAWDVRQARIFGLCRNNIGIDSFRELVVVLCARHYIKLSIMSFG